MNKSPVLIIMAAGLGSRYGGLKQIDPIDEFGNVIVNYSIYDALKAGFKDFIFVIKRENEADFKERITDKLNGKCNYRFAYQEISDIPKGYKVPDKRVKPWGTAHAVRACRNYIKDEPFAVINADDFYGYDGFKKLYDYLLNATDGHYAMVGFVIGKTVTENGHVARGVCEYDKDGFLTSITERTKIEKRSDGIAFTEDEGKTYTYLPDDTLVSMNFWGFTSDFMREINNRFSAFLDGINNDTSAEYFLPGVVEQLLSERKCDVSVLSTDAKWYGVTYKEDKEGVVSALKKLRNNGQYEGIED